MQKEFRIRRELVLEVQDVATSEDPMIAYLERRGWTTKKIEDTQNKISEKLTPDLFGRRIELSGLEVTLQEDIDKYFLEKATR